MSDIRFNNWYHQSGTGGVYQDGSGNVGIGSSVPTSNLDVAGTVTATTFTGNLTGDITANQITVGDKFINSSGVGLGTTSTAARNVGVNTAIGTLIYNATTNQVEGYGPEGWINVKTLVNEGLTATGGLINEYEEGGFKYRAHIFNSSDTFNVSKLGDFGNTVDYLVVAGGGGGGGDLAGGGGAGGFRVGTAYPV